ncbi:MAG: ComEA family DNA-binding protein [Anaerolineae bacterium]|nr:MAG: ComEA family DNA-binding protein [Anaerolineae bacterium]
MLDDRSDLRDAVRAVLYILIGVGIGLLAAGMVYLASKPPQGEAVTLRPPPTPEPIYVYVTGAVPRPGVYTLPRGSRVADAIDAAGGFLTTADPGQLNLAAPLTDGEWIEVLTSEEAEALQALLVDINTATASELEELPGIGPTLAEKIVEYRDEHGDFARIEDLLNVPGIGQATFERIRDLITVEE